MDDGEDQVTLTVRADAAAFAKEIGEMRAQLEGPLVAGAEKAGHAIEAGLLRAVRTGKTGFEDLGKVALSILSQIASAAVRDGLHALGIGNSKSSGGLAGFGASLIQAALGLPGRATGGPVSPGQAYLVGERGPELFVPTSSGQVMTQSGSGGGPRDVRVSITIQGQGHDSPQALARSARQVARAVRGALAE